MTRLHRQLGRRTGFDCKSTRLQFSLFVQISVSQVGFSPVASCLRCLWIHVCMLVMSRRCYRIMLFPFFGPCLPATCTIKRTPNTQPGNISRILLAYTYTTIQCIFLSNHSRKVANTTKNRYRRSFALHTRAAGKRVSRGPFPCSFCSSHYVLAWLLVRDESVVLLFCFCFLRDAVSRNLT